MPRHYIDEEWDRDALFASRNLVSVEFAADHLRVSTHAVEKTARRAHGGLLMWLFGGRGQMMRKYRDVYVDMGPASGPDLPHAWHSHTPEVLLGQARQQHADAGWLTGPKPNTGDLRPKDANAWSDGGQRPHCSCR